MTSLSKGTDDSKSRSLGFLDRIVRHPEIGALGAYFIFFALFALSSPNFLTQTNFAAIGNIAAQLGIVSIGITLLMISGEFDLSVGAVFAMAAFIFAVLVEQGIDPILVILITLVSCAGMGLLNGFLTVKLRISSFIVTLGTLFVWRGALLFGTAGYVISISPNDYTNRILNGISGYFVGQFRLPVLWFILLTVLFSFLLTQTRYGNWVFATGGNLVAAKEMGVNTDRVKLINFTITGLLAGLSGMLQISRFLTASNLLAEGLELQAIAVSVIGGTSLFGGSGTIIGTIIGTFLMSQVSSGLILIGAPPFLFTTFTGVIVVVAVFFYNSIRKKVVLG